MQYIQEIASSTGAAQTLTLTIANTPTLGNLLVARVAQGGIANSNNGLLFITDSKGNKWTMDGQDEHITGHVQICSTMQDKGQLLSSGDTVTFTFKSPPTSAIAIIEEFEGASNLVDFSNSVGATLTNRDGGPQFTTYGYDLIVVSYAGQVNETGFTINPNYQHLTHDFLNRSTTLFLGGMYAFTTSTVSNFATTATGTASVSTAGCSVSYKGLAFAPVHAHLGAG
jgi:hypothetical protein